MDATALLIRFLSRKFRQIIVPVQTIFGFRIIDNRSAEKTVGLSTFLTETDEKIQELPRTYRELFDLDKQIKEELYVNASDNIRGAEKAYEAWKDDFPSSIAIIGEKGSGKTTLVNFLKEKVFPSEEILDIKVDFTCWKMEQVLSLLGNKFEVDQANRPEAIVNAILAKEGKMVVTLEGIQNLYLRNINGFDALEALWLIISETKSKVLWVASCSRYAWDFLNKMSGIETHFSHHFTVDKLSPIQIQDLIIKRHTESGFKLRFEPDEQIRKSRNFKKRLNDPKELQAYLKEIYFEKLSDIAEGNASVASILWLRSITEIERRTLIISPVQTINLDALEVNKAETLFALAAIVFHDTLKTAELCRVLNLSLSQSRVLMSRLKSRGLLLEEEGGYFLNELVFRQLIRLLKKRNIIH